MFNLLLPFHIKEIKKYKHENNLVVVYKGFPIYFIQAVAKIYKPINSMDKILTDNKLDLGKIVNLVDNTIREMLSLNAGIYIMTYEELLVLEESLNLSILKNTNFLILENNLFSEFPNQTTVDFPDVDEVVEKGDFSFKENELFNRFYANSTKRHHLQLVQYRDIKVDQSNIEIQDFFNTDFLNDLNIEPIKNHSISSSQYILVSETDSNYFRIKYSTFSEKSEEKQLDLIIDNITFKRTIFQKELKILKLIFELNGVTFKLYLTDNIGPSKSRDEFGQILQKYWQSNTFRELTFYNDPDKDSSKIVIIQNILVEEIVQEVEKAKNGSDFRDIFITAPTGAGKSLLFQIPAIFIAEEYQLVTIIVSPLKALMYDQVTSLKNKGIDISAYINSDITFIERERIIKEFKQGSKSILYLSPELLLSYDVRQFIGDRKLGLLVIDEAHLVTTWGRDFRVDYWYLGTYIKRLRKYLDSRFPTVALTATAVYSGQDDIAFSTIESLNMQLPILHMGSARRDEIQFDIKKFDFTGSHEERKVEKTAELVINNIKNNIKTIVYFPWTNQVNQVMRYIPDDMKNKVGRYYGDVDKTEKQIVIDKFQSGDKIIVLATKAFGMGIDVSDIQVIYHHAPSGTLADYVQEIGRVARDKEIKGKAMIDFNEKDLKFTKILIGLSAIRQYQVRFVLQKIYELYQLKKERQMLISVEDFAFIFSGQKNEIETKVKSALLLIEKDLQQKVRGHYNLLWVRPKPLFSIVFACIPSSIEKHFLKKYGTFCKKITTLEENTRENIWESTIADAGNIYELCLDKIWERFFSNDSFPVIKRKFFNKELFTEFKEQPYPRYKLFLKLKKNPTITLLELEKYFAVLDKAFHDLTGTSFTSETLKQYLSRGFNDEILSRRISNLIINLYATPYRIGESNSRLDFDTFIQTRKDNSGKDIYNIIGNRYFQVKHWIIRKFNTMFLGDSNIFCKYIAINDAEDEYRIKLAFVIESFLLGNYELTGGQLSQIYIRIGDPYKISMFSADSHYSNSVLQDIEDRHSRSVITMSNFFNYRLSNSERWDYIENYFLGKLKVGSSSPETT